MNTPSIGKRNLLDHNCMFIRQSKKEGDVNIDRKVDISDIVAIINQISGLSIFPESDVNHDGQVDISDIVAIINIISKE